MPGGVAGMHWCMIWCGAVEGCPGGGERWNSVKRHGVGGQIRLRGRGDH